MPEGITLEGSIIVIVGGMILLWVLSRTSSQISMRTTHSHPRKVVNLTKRVPLTLSKTTWELLEKQAARKGIPLEEYLEDAISTLLNRMSF